MVQTNLRPRDPGKLSPDLSCVRSRVRTTLRPRDPGKVSPDMSRVISCDPLTFWVSRDPRAHDPGNKPPDLPRDWSATQSHVAA